MEIILEVIGCITFGILASVITYFVAKKIFNSNANILLEQAKARAKAIEYEAEKFLNESKIKYKEQEISLRQEYEKKQNALNREYEQKLCTLEKDEEKLKTSIERERQSINDERQRLNRLENRILHVDSENKKVRQQYESARKEALKVLSNQSGITIQEAKDMLLGYLDEELTDEKAHMIRRYEFEAKQEAQKKAHYILAQATTRYAGEFATERLINVLTLPSDELKGRIIGKEGRNIKALEMISGVDIIIDDTPNTIIVSSFNLYRRAIALKTLEALIEDGRIQPSRIEEVYEKTKAQMEEQILQDGENIVLDMGLGYMHPELKKLLGKMKYRASYGQNALGHSIEVANLAAIIAGELGGDEKLARRAGILHDIGKALTQEVGGNHVELGVEVCSRYKEHPVVINAILAHHGYEEVKSIECAAVCTADVLSAARPGARREVLESFLKRVQELERIAMDKFGVKQAYAISAGREVRVIVRADLVSDEESVVLAREIAKEIEGTLQYPGEIKVSVIREMRAIEYAK
ncbi:ribonuclease Y [Helicobacter sp. MIT 00-7814]|nr:ribonuclease Y [Helicobacter sp. MIT 99-10781]RDU56427.1 ribonuclease Y [Helicobacter sp. MIT 00-7814]